LSALIGYGFIFKGLCGMSYSISILKRNSNSHLLITANQVK